MINFTKKFDNNCENLGFFVPADKPILKTSKLDEGLKSRINQLLKKIEKSEIVGKDIADKLISSKIKKIIFDRNGYNYHGWVKALADAMREMKIKF